MEIKIIRSSRKTMVIEITEEASVLIRAPYWVKKQEIERFVKEKSDWIEKSRKKVLARREEIASQKKLTAEELHQLADQASVVIPEKVKFYAGRIGVSYGRITIRKQKTRWGSCSAKGNLNFNCLLMLTPERVQNYVVVHELCHRKEMNHSERFWKEVERILPDYRERRKWLKEYGDRIIGRMN